MAQVQVRQPTESQPAPPRPIPNATNKPSATRRLSRLGMESFTPVSDSGCFEADRVLRSGYVQKRTSKTKTWKPAYLVLRSDALSIYRSDKEDRLRRQVHLSDLTAVAFLKDPKHKRENVFGLFSPSKNFHFEALTAEDAEAWVTLLRREARIEEEEEEMFLASPQAKRQTPMGLQAVPVSQMGQRHTPPDRMLSSSPEPVGSLPSADNFALDSRRKSSQIESSGLSGNELISDFSDNEAGRLPGASIESLALQSPILSPKYIAPTGLAQQIMPGVGRSLSQMSINVIEQDPDRVIWQGWLKFLRTKRGVKQWKHYWGVLRPRNLIMYKDESEYTAQLIIRLSIIVNVVDIDPQSKSKTNCFQIITEEKSYRFCAHDEEALVQCLGAFKSLLAKRKELENRVAAAASGQTGQQDMSL